MLIFAGCSFTDKFHDGYIENNIKTWPEIVANFRNEKYINIGKGGASNQLIFNRTLDAIKIYEKIDKLEVYVLWTSTARVDLYGQTLFFHFDRNLTSHDKKQLHIINQIRELLKDREVEHKVISNNNRYIKVLDEYCNLKGIKIIHGFALDYFVSTLSYIHNDFEPFYITKMLREKKDILKMPDIENNVGFVWPYIEKNKLHISKNDLHPNQEGHNYIADVFLGLAEGSKTEFANQMPKGFIYD